MKWLPVILLIALPSCRGTTRYATQTTTERETVTQTQTIERTRTIRVYRADTAAETEPVPNTGAPAKNPGQGRPAQSG